MSRLNKIHKIKQSYPHNHLVTSFHYILPQMGRQFFLANRCQTKPKIREKQMLVKVRLVRITIKVAITIQLYC